MNRRKTGTIVLLWLLICVLLLVLPQLLPARSTITIMNQMAITIVFAMSYNVLLGQAGLLSFGHAVYMGLGGIFCLHIMSFVQHDGWLIPLPLLPLFGGLFGLLMAMIFGSFSTRRAGSTFTMISLGIVELVVASTVVIGVFFAASGDRTYAPAVLGHDFSSQRDVYYLIVSWMMLCVLVMYYLAGTPAGKMISASRDNRQRTEFIGYSQWLLRYLAFCIGGFFAGVAGGLFAINYEIVTGENLDLAASGQILMVTVLGGTGFFLGPVIGAVVFTLMQTVMSLHTELWRLYLGILFVAMTMYFPGGLTGILAMHAAPLQLGRLQLLAWPYCKMLLPAGICLVASIAFLESVYNHNTIHQHIGSAPLSAMLADAPALFRVACVLITAVGFYLTHKSLAAVKTAWQQASDTPFDPASGIHRDQRWHIE